MKMPIRVYNRFLDLLMETDSYQSLQYKRSYHGIGDFELHINRYMHGADNFQKGNIIAMNKQENKAGIILTKEIDLDASGKESENFKLTGVTMDGLMNRRVSVPPKDTAYDRKSGDAETVMKHYVYNHFVDPADKSRKLDMLEIAPNQNRGEYVSRESRFKNIGEELEGISIESGLGWGVFVDYNTKKLVFDCFQAKNLVQGNNEGNSPVFFSPEFETIKSQSFIDSDNDFKNVGYVGGQGEGAERKIITIGDNAGWDRIETFVDARDVGATEDDEELTDKEIEGMLIDRGKKKMKEMETLFSLEAEILTPITRKTYEYTHEGYLHPAQPHGRYEAKQQQVTPFQYEEDFDLGDRVQIVNKSWGLQMTAPIIDFLEVHEPGGFRLEATFGQSRPTLITKIQDKFNEIQGIEKQEAPAAVAVEHMKKAMQYGDNKLNKEERARIQQAIDNLESARNFTKDYAEKAIHKGSVPPDDKTKLWIDISGESDIYKRWDLDKQDWIEGPGGPQGITGPAGEDGSTTYTWIKYADDKTGSDMSNYPDDKSYIGIATNQSTKEESDDPADYVWALMKGPKGDKGNKGPQGIEGPVGPDGKPTYTWVRYADDGNGNGMSNYPDGKEYIGLAFNKDAAIESTNPSDYTWTLIKGDKGEQGVNGDQGIQGDQGEQGPNKVNKDTDFDSGYDPSEKETPDGAQDKANQAEQNANDFSKDASNIMEGILNVGSVPIQTAYSGARIEFDGTNGFVQYDKNDNPVAWFDLEGNARFSGDISGATGTFGDVNVKDGDFTLEDDQSNVAYSITPKRNLLKDHSFELLKPDYDTYVSEDRYHNIKGIINPNLPQEELWVATGNPKVAMQDLIAYSDALPIFGERAIVIKDANFVRQKVDDGVGGGRTYTISGFFKRQWNLPGGVPRFEVDHRDGTGKLVERLINKTFPRVDSYDALRYATVFKTSNDFSVSDYLDIKISGGDSNWVQCDGVQIVQGDRPSVYQPDDSVWETTRGNYPIENAQNLLWFGTVYLRSDHILYPDKKITDCANGWILKWSNYVIGSGSSDSDWQYSYIPKQAAYHTGGHREVMYSGYDYVSHKYFYIEEDYIKGHDNNGSGEHRNIALRAIYEF